jgi:hypothetical protein
MTTNNVSSSSSSGRIGFAGLLTIIFIILKLNPGGHLTTAVVHWSWLWVLSPLWISFGIVLGIMVIALIVAMLVAIFSD